MISFYIPGDKTSLFPRPGILSPSLVLPACLSCPGTGIFFTVTPEHKKATGDAIRRQWLDILFPQLIIFWEKFSSKQHSCVALQGSQLYSFSPRAAPASGVLALGCVLAAPLGPCRVAAVDMVEGGCLKCFFVSSDLSKLNSRKNQQA